ncbi:MAG: 50S ribosomal protein L22 [bacterium]|nr:50S ribosomal protein L22 [bacterium]
MQFVAKSLYIHFSPYKLRPLVDVIRGKNAKYALNWLTTCALKRAVPIRKIVASAVANAKNLQNIDVENLAISDIRVDEGPSFRYSKAGAMGRSNIYKRRLSHVKVVLKPIESTQKKEA